jgi:hypothetical protein
MKTKDNSRYKQENELLKISPLIRSLGYIPNFNMCGDKPDICLPSFENREIGIEVTEYAERYYIKAVCNEQVRGNLQLKAHQDLKKIMDSYIEYASMYLDVDAAWDVLKEISNEIQNDDIIDKDDN